ncbi:DUF2690 domain-containing protein [Streptomyces sp. NPDC052179]|uniref:DUF2690 domain-containing protein n=1 Tax=Streptomyces sp. NPDC052179 TaxID=3155680 RepID=UPI003423F3B5
MTDGSGPPSPGGEPGAPGGDAGSAGGDGRRAGAGGGRGFGRAAAWIRRHGPSTLIGSVLVTVVGATVTVVLTALIGDGGGGGEAEAGPGPSGVSARVTAGPGPTPRTSPPGCTGEGCAGLDPKDTGCGDHARTVGSEWAGTMSLEIRYSPECRTVWGKLTGAEVGDTVEIRTSPTRYQIAKVLRGHTKYTSMLPAPAGFTAQASAVAVNATVERDVPPGHVVRVGADSSDLPSGGTVDGVVDGVVSGTAGDADSSTAGAGRNPASAS